MEEQAIVTKQGVYGRVQITLPMPVKKFIIEWQQKSGMGKAEFLRVALMIGASQLAESVNAKQPGEGYYLLGSEYKGERGMVGPA